MNPLAPRSLRRAPQRRQTARPLSAVVAAAIVAPLVALSALAPTPAVAAPGRHGAVASSDITIVQANLLSPQSEQTFERDARRVFAESPDLVTFNEVAFRRDASLAPAGYELWRTPGQYTGPTPVAWRTSAWSKLDQGTTQISDYARRPPGRSTLLGMRYANWVTLSSRTDGRVLSVVSAHLPPPVNGMPDLRRSSAQNVAALVSRLGERGPVLIGGDFNLHYRSHRFPADVFAAAGMRSTYELTGTVFPTGDHGGLTIDYLFVRGADQLSVDRHYPVELNSDHDAVVAKLSWKGASIPRATELVSNPHGTPAERSRVLNAVVGSIEGTTPGETLAIATRGLEETRVRDALLAAHARGVSVRLLTRSPELTADEQILNRATAKTWGSWVRRCREQCATTWSTNHRPTLILVSDRRGAPRLGIDANRRLRTAMLERVTRSAVITDPTVLGVLNATFGATQA